MRKRRKRPRAVLSFPQRLGDKVIASKYAGTMVKLDGEEYTIVSQSDILAKVE